VAQPFQSLTKYSAPNSKKRLAVLIFSNKRERKNTSKKGCGKQKKGKKSRRRENGKVEHLITVFNWFK